MQVRLVLCLILIAGLSQVSPAPAQESDVSNLLKISDEMIQTTSRLRGLEPKTPIQTGVKDREEISRYLNERVQAEYSQGELEKEGAMLRKLGLIPADMDYRDFIIRLLTEQIGGFFDTDKKSFYIASWLPAEEQKPVMVHELVHALQDQHFDVARILKEDRAMQNDDRALAHQALLEGDGMVVMLQYFLDPVKRHFSQLPDLSDVMQKLTLTMQAQYPMFKSAPAILRETLLFSYGYGASFLQHSWNRDPSWPAVNKIYSDLPASTEQIMHPEKYFLSRDEPKSVTADSRAAALGDNWKVAYRNVLGEFSLGLLLDLHLTEEHSRRAVLGWGGDQVLLLENNEGKNAVLISTVWDTAEDAEKFYAAMDEWFRRHFPDVERSNETPAGFAVTKDGETSLIRRDGASVRFIIGIPQAESPKLKEF